jgi:hypothetical protein
MARNVNCRYHWEVLWKLRESDPHPETFELGKAHKFVAVIGPLLTQAMPTFLMSAKDLLWSHTFKRQCPLHQLLVLGVVLPRN